MSSRQSTVPPASLALVGVMVSMVVLVLAACGGSSTFSADGRSATEAAVELIEGDALAQRLGISKMSGAQCSEPSSFRVGEVFQCTADSDGAVVELELRIDSEDALFASPRNIVTRDLISEYAADAVRLLNDENGFDFPVDALDCGRRSVVLDEDGRMNCVLTDPDSGAQFNTGVRVDPQTARISVIVGEQLDP